MDRASFLAGLAEQKRYCEKRSPLYFALLTALEQDLLKGSAPWFERLSKAWHKRVFGAPYEAPLLLLAALHCQALKGEPSLAAVYPTCGETQQERAPQVVRAYLAAAPKEFWTFIEKAILQTNEATRSVGWMLPACIGFMNQSLPFHLVDMGTSAGLNLIGDYLERPASLCSDTGKPLAEAPPRWGDIPYPILSRNGLDRAPRDLAKPEDRLWLKACIWADDEVRRRRFDKAAAMFLSLARMRTGPRLHVCEFTQMPAWVFKNIPVHPEEGLLLFNSQAADFLSDADYETLRQGVAKTLAAWGERGYWVELELPRGDRKAFHQLRVHRFLNGKLETRVLATTSAHPSEVRLRSGWDFLIMSAQVKRRFTIEEPEKQLASGTYKLDKSGKLQKAP